MQPEVVMPWHGMLCAGNRHPPPQLIPGAAGSQCPLHHPPTVAEIRRWLENFRAQKYSPPQPLLTQIETEIEVTPQS